MEENDEVLFWICLYIYVFSVASTRNPEKTTFALVSFISSIIPAVPAIKTLTKRCRNCLLVSSEDMMFNEVDEVENKLLYSELRTVF